MARPRKTINWTQVGKLCELHCTQEEIASFFDVSLDTIERDCVRTKKYSFAEFHRKKKDKGKVSAKRKAFSMVGVNPAVTIFWLKNHCGMSDKIEHSGPGGAPIKFTIDLRNRKPTEDDSASDD